MRTRARQIVQAGKLGDHSGAIGDHSGAIGDDHAHGPRARPKRVLDTGDRD